MPKAIVSAFWAVISLGVVPVVVWGRRFGAIIAQDRQVMAKIAGWAGAVRGESQVGKPLRVSVGRLRDRQGWYLGGLALSLVAAGAVVWAAAAFDMPGRGWKALLGTTFGFQWPRFHHARLTPIGVGVFAAWTSGLGLAYCFHLTRVSLHAAAVRRFLDEFNRTVAIEEGLPPVLMPPIGFGFSPVWALLAVLLASASGWWAVPLAIAGATDRRYRRRAMPRVRADLLDRVKHVSLAHPSYAGPGRLLPATAASGRVPCETPGCGAVLSADARFCGRCGARRGRPVEMRA